MLSVPVWMNILAQWGGIWGFFTLMTHAPSYFKFIHGWSIQAVSFFFLIYDSCREMLF
jgi:hypothetical protein